MQAPSTDWTVRLRCSRLSIPCLHVSAVSLMYHKLSAPEQLNKLLLVPVDTLIFDFFFVFCIQARSSCVQY